jgi:hypothetical protein
VIRRALLAAAILLGITATAPFGSREVLFAAPAGGVDQLWFATGLNSDGSIPDARIEFGKEDAEVWAIFDFSNVPPGAKMSFLLRVGNAHSKEDYSWGDINCCRGYSSGRFGFPLPRRNGNFTDLPGGAYELVIFEGGKEVAKGGFGVKGKKGLDNGNANSNH